MPSPSVKGSRQGPIKDFFALRRKKDHTGSIFYCRRQRACTKVRAILLFLLFCCILLLLIEQSTMLTFRA